jgi:lysophospholipase L1-like esterase
MRKKSLIMILLTVVCVITVYSQDSVYVHLPDSVFTTSGSKFSIYYTNLIRGRFLNKEQIFVNCDIGYPDSMKYNLDSIPAGTYDFHIQIKDSIGNFIEESDTKIVVNEKFAAYPDTLKILFIGDSFTENGTYLKYIKDLYGESTYYPIQFLGTKYNSQYKLYHEGYSGRGWDFFGNNIGSPFVFETFGELDIERYLIESLEGKIPDLIVIFLGINDVGIINTQTIDSIDEGITTQIFNYPRMEKLISSLVLILPEAKIGIVLAPPTNEREYSYTNSEQPDYLERKLLHHRLNERYCGYFKEFDNENISIIPVNLSIDTYNGFNEPNGYDASASIHPNTYGYNQIGTSIFAWIKYQVSKKQDQISFSNIIITVNRFSLDISWEYPVLGVSYNVYRSSNPYEGFLRIQTTSNLYYTDSDIMGSRSFFYRITAVDGSE